jgi:leader peptidase (prepilin peptidase)/N-methyltransferase
MPDLTLYFEIFPWLPYAIAGFFGLVFGSFLTLLFYRIQNREPWLCGRAATRSKCPSCQMTLGVLDLIPVVSWILARGRCRHCKQAVSIRYLLIETITACLFIFVVFLFTH